MVGDEKELIRNVRAEDTHGKSSERAQMRVFMYIYFSAVLKSYTTTFQREILYLVLFLHTRHM